MLKDVWSQLVQANVSVQGIYGNISKTYCFLDDTVSKWQMKEMFVEQLQCVNS